MSNPIALGGLPITNGDIPFKNYGLVDIPAGAALVFDTSNPFTSGDGPGGVKVPATSGSIAEPCGIAVETIPAGKIGRVRKLGAYPAVASGTVTYGDFVQIDSASGKEGRVKTCGAATAQLGQALNTATDGGLVLVWIQTSANA